MATNSDFSLCTVTSTEDADWPALEVRLKTAFVLLRSRFPNFPHFYGFCEFYTFVRCYRAVGPDERQNENQTQYGMVPCFDDEDPGEEPRREFVDLQTDSDSLREWTRDEVRRFRPLQAAELDFPGLCVKFESPFRETSSPVNSCFALDDASSRCKEHASFQNFIAGI
ncbi:uncharacterized protein BP01DRAFT_381004 [Aspergillus saccharolyticus JOP 1030-1]|uniref:Uncharacterized protein n=1 Tax=Aspergillus saccharolyticus JOP 1030-1 TaxID=1450539 RepID=A0A318ZS23_9EURO|nr:hypothetical protein BP01DRAFT_381004 [Aspergillus saccharolyticus JOP 1030-1]PYH47163.1 hypothetical protein BP01DRAFT_381004 [Aspergillus saccharolyticus JOP 1030-1]